MNNATTFLLVDDDADDTLLFEDALKRAASSVSFEAAANGQEALDKLNNRQAPLPDIIFLDLNMPRMDGKECLAHLKASENLQHIPVIMYTTSSQSRDIEQTMLMGAKCFITKPSNVKELQYILSEIAENVHRNLEKTLRALSDTAATFIVC